MLLVLLLLFGVGTARAADVPVPELRARVTDQIDLLPAERRAALEARLEAFEREKGSQLAVLIVSTTQPETIEQYSIRVVDAWKLGRAEPDDGVLLLVAQSDRTLRIEVGRGLEGAIPDAIARRVIEETIVPSFREGDFAGGIEAGVEALLGLIQGEPLPAPSGSSSYSLGPGPGFHDGWIGAAFVAALFLRPLFRRLLGPLLGAGAAAAITFGIGQIFIQIWQVALFFGFVVFVLVFSDSRGRGGSSGFGSSSGRSGRSGGGFSGGGGSFGGGGASGRW